MEMPRVIPLHKAADIEDVNYPRQISLLSIFRRLLEKIVANPCKSFFVNKQYVG